MCGLSIIKSRKLLLATIYLFLVLFTLLSSLSSYIKLSIGLLFCVLLIGYIFLRIMFRFSFEESFLMAPIIGLGIQNFIILTLYNIVAPYFLEKVDFKLFILSLNACLLIALLILKLREVNNLKFPTSQFMCLLKEPIMFIFLLGFIIRLFYQTFNFSSIQVDAALYCDAARQLVNQGNFTSYVINDGSTNPYQLSYGLISYPFTWFLIALFFLFGEPNFAFAKLYVVFVGTVLVFPTYLLTRKLFNKQIALIASSIVAFHPLLNFYSAVLYGPEITSLLFGSSLIYLLVNMAEYSKIKYAILAGMLASLVAYSWRWELLFIYLASFLVYLKFTKDFKEVFLWFLLIPLCFISLGFTVVIYPLTLSFLAVLIYVLLLHFGKHGKKNNDFLTSIIIFFTIIGIVAQVVQNRSYFLPELIVQISRAPVAIESRVRSILLPNLQAFPELLIKYFSFTSYYAGYPLLLFAFLSMAYTLYLKQKLFLWSFILFSAIFSSLMIPSIMFEGGGLFFSRFYIAPTWFLSILAAVFIYGSKNLYSQERRSLVICVKCSLLKRLHFDFLKIKVITLIPILTGIVILPSFYYGYVDGIQIWMKECNFLKYQSVKEAINWISQNTDPQCSILSLDPAWTAWFSNRPSIGLIVKRGGQWTRNIELNELLQLFSDFKAKYLFLTPYTLSLVSSTGFLRRVYESIPQSIYLLEFDKNLLFNASIQTFRLPALSLIFKSKSTPYSIIYELKNCDITVRFLWADDQFSEGWQKARGSVSIDNGIVSLVTNATEDWGMYIRYTFSNKTYQIKNSTYIALNVVDVSEKSHAGIYLRFTDKTDYAEYFSNPGFYLIDLKRFVGKNLSSIYLYNLLELKKTLGVSFVKYDFIALVDIIGLLND